MHDFRPEYEVVWHEHGHATQLRQPSQNRISQQIWHQVVDEGGINASPEVIAEAAEDLQKEGIQSAADLAKLPLRKQLFAYALITASTPIGTERNAVRNQMLNVLETGISDRGKSIVDAQKADTAARRLNFDIRNNQDKLLKEGTDAAVRVNKALVDAIYN